MKSNLEAELEFAAAELEQEMQGGGQSPACNRALLEQLVNQCVGNVRSCVIRAHGDLARGLVKCRLNPWCNARDVEILPGTGAVPGRHHALRRGCKTSGRVLTWLS